jgi:hypothetical protein
MFRGAAALADAVDGCEVAATAEVIVEARRLIDRLQAKVATAEVEFVRACGHEVEGHATYGSFLRGRCGATTSESRRTATRTKKLGRWPEILDAWSDQRLTGAQVDVLAAKVPAHHVARFAEDCSAHVEFLTGMSTETTIAKLADWLERADAVDDREDTEIGTEPLVEICRFYVAHHQQPPSAGRPDRGVIVADVAALFRAILRGDGVRTAAQLETYLAAQPELGALERGLFCDAFDGHGGTARTLDGHTVTDTLLRHVTRDGIPRTTPANGASHHRPRPIRQGLHRVPETRHGRPRRRQPHQWGVAVGMSRPPLAPLRRGRHHRHQHRLPQNPTRAPRPPPQRLDRPHQPRRISHVDQSRRSRTRHPPTDVARGRTHPPSPHHRSASTRPPLHPRLGRGRCRRRRRVDRLEHHRTSHRAAARGRLGTLELGDDEDHPTEIARIDAYIRRRHRRAIGRERTGAA